MKTNGIVYYYHKFTYELYILVKANTTVNNDFLRNFNTSTFISSTNIKINFNEKYFKNDDGKPIIHPFMYIFYNYDKTNNGQNQHYELKSFLSEGTHAFLSKNILKRSNIDINYISYSDSNTYTNLKALETKYTYNDEVFYNIESNDKFCEKSDDKFCEKSYANIVKSTEIVKKPIKVISKPIEVAKPIENITKPIEVAKPIEIAKPIEVAKPVEIVTKPVENKLKKNKNKQSKVFNNITYETSSINKYYSYKTNENELNVNYGIKINNGNIIINNSTDDDFDIKIINYILNNFKSAKKSIQINESDKIISTNELIVKEQNNKNENIEENEDYVSDNE